jgi:hypothetical protein
MCRRAMCRLPLKGKYLAYMKLFVSRAYCRVRMLQLTHGFWVGPRELPDEAGRGWGGLVGGLNSVPVW